MKKTRLSISIPENLSVDLMKYIMKKSHAGKIRGMKNILYTIAIMEKLGRVGELSDKAKADCIEMIGIDIFNSLYKE